jgi:NAD(P)-dependent dehydrogenase (short-subunit alcohol dehydrogenase family)
MDETATGAPLTGRVAVITGATRGIGLACAETLAARGALVVLHGRDGPLLSRQAQRITEICGDPSRARAVAGDVTSVTDTDRLAATAAQITGHIDILIAAAGITGAIGVATRDLDPAAFDDVIQTNLTGAFLTCRSAIPWLERSTTGRIVLVSSTSGLRGEAGRAGYVASKWALRGLTRTLAHELARHDVTVNCVCPNFTLGERTQRIVEETAAMQGGGVEQVLAALRAETLLGRILEPQDTARLVAYLASDDARNITGQDFVVDGGLVV